jgi:hypothetical protein
MHDPQATKHLTRYEEGSDANSHIARCSCGWACSGTYLDVRARAVMHREYPGARPERKSKGELVLPSR